MNQQQREAYIKMREAELYGHQEPTMGIASPSLIDPSSRARHAAVTRTEQRAAARRMEQRNRRQSLAKIVRTFLWFAIWYGLMCLCQRAAEASGAHDAISLAYALEAVTTVLVLTLAFWRTVLSLIWTVVVLVVLAAVVKWAFLFLF